MRVISSKIGHIESYAIDSVQKKLLFKNQQQENAWSKISTALLRYLLNVHEGVVYTFSFSNKILSHRIILEELKQKGFIEHYGEGVVHCDYPRLNFFGIFIFIEKELILIRSWGSTLPFEDKNVALSKALGEGLERQASYYLKNSTSIQYPVLRKGDASFLYDLVPGIRPSDAAENDIYVRSKEDMKDVVGFMAPTLTGGSKKFLPLGCFYWGEKGDDLEKSFQEHTTSGSGGGYTQEAATLSGLYELIERDLFLLYWYSKIKPAVIDIEHENGEFFNYIKDAKERFNLEIYFLNTKYDIDIPACVCVIVDPVLHLVSVGAKVSLDPEHVLRGAFEEALATLNSIRDRKVHISEEKLKKIMRNRPQSNIEVNKALRGDLYCSPYGISLIKDLWINNNNHHITFRNFSEDGKKFSSKKEELRFVIAFFKKLVQEKGEGYHAYIHKFSSHWTKLCKYHVIHIFVPSFLKLHLTEVYVTKTSTRLTEFSRSKGVTTEMSDRINTLPHLFP